MKAIINKLENSDWRKTILLVSIIIMLSGLLFSRGLLSVGLIGFIVISIFHTGIIAQLKRFFRSPFLVCMTLLFFIPFISGLWSEDISRWSQIMRIKLPLLLLPV